MQPVLAAVQREFSGRVVFIAYQWEVEAQQQAALSLGARGHPTYIVFDGQGEEVARLFGFQTQGELAAVLEEALAATE